MSNKTLKGRNFAVVIYPDSLPDNFIQIIQEFAISSFLSPLHDKDINADGTPKKPHYHLQLLFDGNKTIQQVQSIVSTLTTIPVELLASLRGYARYLCHLDNPEKYQYSVADVRSFGGADYLGTIGMAIDKYFSIQEMIEYCNTCNIYDYCDLLDYASKERFDWFRILCDCGTVVMEKYLKSRFFKKKYLIEESGCTSPKNQRGITIFSSSQPELPL